MAIRQTIAPAAEPVTLQEVKDHLRVSGSQEDDLLTRLIGAARAHCEEYTARQLINATWKLTLDSFTKSDWHFGPNGAILLPRPRVSSVTSVVYSDIDGNSTTLSASTYQLDDQSEPARLVPAYNCFWPSVRSQLNAVAITYVSGYGSASTNVPDDIRSGILLLIGHLYENREQNITGAIVSDLKTGIEQLWYPYRVF